MRVASSGNRRPKNLNAAVSDVLSGVSPERLRAFVELLSFPRHYLVERRANLRAREMLLDLLRDFGYAPVLQGIYDNIVAVSGESEGNPCLLLGAHYDSVPGTPGAEDNASAVAVCLECARLVKEHDV